MTPTASEHLLILTISTRFITDAINYWYGLVFAGCCAALIFIVYFFMMETKDRSLEEIDTMHILRVNPIHSAKWDGSKVPEGRPSESGEDAASRA